MQCTQQKLYTSDDTFKNMRDLKDVCKGHARNIVEKV